MKKEILCLMVLFFLILYCGCINEDNKQTTNNNNNNNNQNDNITNNTVYFNVWFSSSEQIKESIVLEIKTNNTMVFNSSIKPESGSLIYEEEASGLNYYIYATWNNKTVDFIFHPNGENSLFLEIKNNEIGFQEITD